VLPDIVGSMLTKLEAYDVKLSALNHFMAKDGGVTLSWQSKPPETSGNDNGLLFQSCPSILVLET